jgi:hypothetical protein
MGGKGVTGFSKSIVFWEQQWSLGLGYDMMLADCLQVLAFINGITR